MFCFAYKLKPVQIVVKAPTNGSRGKQLVVKCFLPVVVRDSLRVNASNRHKQQHRNVFLWSQTLIILARCVICLVLGLSKCVKIRTPSMINSIEKIFNYEFNHISKSYNETQIKCLL